MADVSTNGRTCCNPLSLPEIPRGKDDWHPYETEMFSHEDRPAGVAGPEYRSVSDPALFTDNDGALYLYAFASDGDYGTETYRTKIVGYRLDEADPRRVEEGPLTLFEMDPENTSVLFTNLFQFLRFITIWYRRNRCFWSERTGKFGYAKEIGLKYYSCGCPAFCFRGSGGGGRQYGGR